MKEIISQLHHAVIVCRIQEGAFQVIPVNSRDGCNHSPRRTMAGSQALAVRSRFTSKTASGTLGALQRISKLAACCTARSIWITVRKAVHWLRWFCQISAWHVPFIFSQDFLFPIKTYILIKMTEPMTAFFARHKTQHFNSFQKSMGLSHKFWLASFSTLIKGRG